MKNKLFVTIKDELIVIEYIVDKNYYSCTIPKYSIYFGSHKTKGIYEIKRKAKILVLSYKNYCEMN